MLQKYAELNQTIFTIDIAPEAILDIDIAAYNKQEGLSLSPEEWNT
jgi:phosphoribosylformylglycinamidine synthase